METPDRIQPSSPTLEKPLFSHLWSFLSYPTCQGLSTRALLRDLKTVPLALEQLLLVPQATCCFHALRKPRGRCALMKLVSHHSPSTS